MKPYVQTHGIGAVWVALAVVAGVIEIAGAARRRDEATTKDRGSRFVLDLRGPRRPYCRGFTKDRAGG